MSTLAVSGVGVRGWVRDVSFDAMDGEIVAVVGPNGAGKTTLLEGIAGLLPRTGSVRANGRELASFRDHARAVAWMPDEVRPAEELSVRDLWEHALAHATRARPDVAKELGVERWMGAPIASLSRGERKRAELAFTLVLGRPIALLDEPFAAFDPIQLDTILGVVVRHAKACGPIVASVHQLELAERFAGRVLLLAEGRSLAFGSLEALKEKTGAASLEGVMRALVGSHAA